MGLSKLGGGRLHRGGRLLGQYSMYNLDSNLSLNMQHDISLALYVLPHVLACLLRQGSPAVLKEVRKYMYVHVECALFAAACSLLNHNNYSVKF